MKISRMGRVAISATALMLVVLCTDVSKGGSLGTYYFNKGAKAWHGFSRSQIDPKGNVLQRVAVTDDQVLINSPSTAIPKGQGCNQEADLPAAATAGTSTNGAWGLNAFNRWFYSSSSTLKGRDSGCAIGSATPTSPEATCAVALEGVPVDETTTELVVTWTGSDAGVVARITCYDDADSGSVILCETRTGYWYETTILGQVASIGTPEDLRVEVEVIALSTDGYPAASRGSSGPSLARVPERFVSPKAGPVARAPFIHVYPSDKCSAPDALSIESPRNCPQLVLLSCRYPDVLRPQALPLG